MQENENNIQNNNSSFSLSQKEVKDNKERKVTKEKNNK